MNPSEYATHPVRDLLERITQLSKSEEFTAPDFLTIEANASALNSTLAAVATVRALLESTPPLRVSGHGLNLINNAFQAIFNELSSYQSSKSLGHIQNAQIQVEQVLMPQLWAFGPSLPIQEGAKLAEVVNQATQTASEAIQRLVTQRDTMVSSQAVLAQRIVEADTLLTSLSESVTKQKAEAASVVAVVTQMNAEKEIERGQSFNDMLTELRGKFSAFQAKSEGEKNGHLTALRRSQQEAAQIVEAVGNTGITGNYQKIAKREAAQADAWRLGTIGFFAVGVLIAGATFVKFWSEPFSPESAWSVLIRLLYALVITAPAWYAAKESARHRSNADRAQQTELELASLGPFIELMPEEKKHQIREDLTKRYFGNQVSEHSAEPPINVKDMKEMGDMFIEFIKTAKK